MYLLNILGKLAQCYYKPTEKWQLSMVLIEVILLLQLCEI